MRFIRATALIAIAAIAACNESSGPRSSVDPAATTASLSAVQQALSLPAIRSFTRFSPGLSPAGSLIQATSPYVSASRRALRLRELAPVLSANAALLSIIPDTLRGSVFRWDSSASAYYRAASTGGPDNGVRFILYAIDDSGRIVYPLVEVGSVDLLDESSETSARLHIVVRDVTGSTTFVDYVISLTPAPNGFTAAASGSMAGALNFAVSVAATGTASAVTTAADALLHVSEPRAEIELHERSTFTASSGATSIDFEIRPQGQSVKLQGLFTMTPVTTDSAVVTINAMIRGNGDVLATVQGSPPDQLVFKDRDGNPTPPGPVLAMLGQLMHAVDGVFQFIHGLFGPVGNVVGGI